MMPLVMSHKAISESIRKKKKKLMTSEPDIIDTSPTPDLNAQDVMELEQAGRIEGTLMSEDKINADLTNIDEEEQYDGVGVSPKQKMRMGRLRKYLDGMDLSHGPRMERRGMPGKMAGDMGMAPQSRKRIGGGY